MIQKKLQKKHENKKLPKIVFCYNLILIVIFKL